jgi:hypothetical protein
VLAGDGEHVVEALARSRTGEARAVRAVVNRCALQGAALAVGQRADRDAVEVQHVEDDQRGRVAGAGS